MNLNNSVDCKVCRRLIPEPFFVSSSDKSLTTMNEILESKTIVYLCDKCTHLQTNEIEDVKLFYEKNYTINLSSDDEDQLYEIKDNKKIYRTEKQAEIVQNKIDLDEKTSLLDYGCAKSSTSKRLSAITNIKPYLFDVSDKYVCYWEKFTLADRWSIIDFPIKDWANKFDVVLSFYALEHITDLHEALGNIHLSLKSGGVFFFMVPNVYSNPADFIVADHVNHFSAQSIEYLLTSCGFSDIKIDDSSFNSAYVVTCIKKEKTQFHPPKPTNNQILKLNEYKTLWMTLNQRIGKYIDSLAAGSKLAVYGSGFYGAYVFSCINNHSVDYFLDQNTKKGNRLFDVPVILPPDLGVETTNIIVALNPKIAQHAIREAGIRNLDKKNLFFI